MRTLYTLSMTHEERAEAARRLAGFRPRITKDCEVCGTPFTTYATGRVGRYCSRPCQQKGYRVEHLEQERARQRERKRAARPPAPERGQVAGEEQ